jgi:uncharacterized protein (TIGR02391 family)
MVAADGAERLEDWLLKHERLANLPVRFDFSRLHPDIAKACRAAFEDGNWADAQLAALRAVNLRARKKAGVSEQDDGGVKTMTQLFASDRNQHDGPCLRVSDGTKSGDGFQDGIQRLFEGAQKLSNPVRHSEPHLGTTQDSAFEYIVLASLLARVIDDATVIQSAAGEAAP